MFFLSCLWVRPPSNPGGLNPRLTSDPHHPSVWWGWWSVMWPPRVGGQKRLRTGSHVQQLNKQSAVSDKRTRSDARRETLRRLRAPPPKANLQVEFWVSFSLSVKASPSAHPSSPAVKQRPPVVPSRAYHAQLEHVLPVRISFHIWELIGLFFSMNSKQCEECVRVDQRVISWFWSVFSILKLHDCWFFHQTLNSS